MRSIFISNNFRNNSSNNWQKTIGKIILYFCIAGFLLVIGIFSYYLKDLPSTDKINKRVIVESTKIYDRTGQHLLYEIHGEEKRTIIPFQEIPDNIKYATIVLEDQDFYSHHGIKLASIFRAAFKDLLKGQTAQGGSTITQQFVKNSLLTREKTFTRKIKEIILAIEIELKFSKNEILGMYLNEIPYGSNAYGIEAASKTFFDKHAKDLTLAEAALLASLPKAPSYYSPYGSHTEQLKNRQEIALNIMSEMKLISSEEAEAAKKEDVLNKIKPNKENIKAPHFVMYVKDELESRYGSNFIEENGLKVYTTLDWSKQKLAEEIVKEEAEKNAKNYNAYNASLVAIDPKNGQILTMVGSKDYFQESQPENCIPGKNCLFEPNVNVAIRERQPGSSFKPYVYLAAFSKGYTPETIIYDTETNFGSSSGEKDYIPQNYNGSFRGPVKMKEALGMSLNIPAVKTLYLVGVNNSIKLAKKLGIGGLNNPERYGLSLVLGGGEVTLLDHTAAYSVLANKGIKHEKTAILKIENNKGEILEEFKEKEGERVIEEKYVAMLDHVLSTNKYRAPVFGEKNLLSFENRQVAAKTGTTNEFRDGWTMGYTPSIAVGVWAGNNNNSSMKIGADGIYTAGPIWRKFMDQVLSNYNIEEFPKYEEEKELKPILMGKLETEKKMKVCEISSKKEKYCLINKYCPDNKIKEKTFTEAHSILYYVDIKDPRGDIPEKPQKDPQFKAWEKGVKNWYKKNKNEKYIVSEEPLKECEQDDFNDYLPNISLLISGENTPFLNIKADCNASYGIKKVIFYVDDEEKSTQENKPYEFIYSIPAEKNNSDIKVKVKLIDDIDNEATDEKTIHISF